MSNNDISLEYRQNIFCLSSSEKNDLDLFYYIRNAFLHYNGAYFTYKGTVHIYKGHRFFSKRHEGEKISIPRYYDSFSNALGY